MMRLLLPLLLLFSFSQLGLAQNVDVRVKFAVIALDTDGATRISFEDQLAQALVVDNYDAVASYTLLPDISDITDPSLREKLLNNGINLVMVLRPVDIGTTATIESVQGHLRPDDYGSIQEFVEGYRGDNFNTQAVIHIAGFLFDAERSMTFWQGVLWLDEEVDSQEQGIDKLIELVLFNLNQSRGSLRKRLGLPPLAD